MKRYINLFFRRIAKDLRQKELLPLKLLFFMHSSTILVLYPYLTIHMRELGINVEETAIMSAVTPVLAIMMPPLAGMIADKIGNFKMLLAFFSAAGGASALLLTLVPVGRLTVTYPDRVVMEVVCTPGNPLSLSTYHQHPCQPLHPFTYKTPVKVEACGFACQAYLNKNESNEILTTKTYGIQLHNIEQNVSRTFQYTLMEADVHVPLEISQAKNHKTLKNNERYNTAIRKLSENTYFFPAFSLYNFACRENSSSYDCLFGYKSELDRHTLYFQKQEVTFGVQPRNPNDEDLNENRQSYDVDYIGNDDRSTRCLRGFGQSKDHISINVPMYKRYEDDRPYKQLDLGSCAPRCIATTPRQSLCSNTNDVIELDMRLTFWSYLVVRVFVAIVSGTSFAMFEGAVIAILREHKADYGLQRIYATVGGMISSPLSGWLIDYWSQGKGYTDYRPIFYLYAALKLISALLMLSINLEFKTPAASVVSDVINVLKKLEMIALFVACFVLGTAWGYIESFLFWLVEDLGGSKSLMGLTITVGGLVGIPVLVLSGPIIKKIGHANVVFIGFVFYAIRLLGYSLIYNPWLCLIFEAMESVTFSLSFTAAVTYAARLSTVTTDSSIQGMLGGLYYGVGKGAGSLVGGYLINAVTIRTTFQIFATSTAITGLIYIAFYHLYMKHRPSEGNDITKKDVEKPPKGFEDINLNSKPAANGNVEHEITPASYEEAVTNLAYEDTEMDQIEKELDKVEKENPVASKQNANP